MAKEEINRKINIGKNCLFSDDIDIRTSDNHAIYEIANNNVTNFGNDIIIHDHVWIGTRVIILKGVEIPENSVIGAFSLVNSKFTENNTIIAGCPAKILKKGVNWDHNSPEGYHMKNE